MKKFLIIGLIGLVATVAMVAIATQDETIERAEVRNPYELTTILNSNASDAEDRIAALEGGSTVGSVLPAYIIVGSATSSGVDVAVSGDISIISDGTVSLSADTVGTAEMADADHGDATWASGAMSLDADVVGTAEMADADHGDGTWASGVFSLDANVVGTAEMDSALVGTALTSVTDFDITIVNGVITSFTKN